jgi:DNA-directed RNA polymerase subunit RPC12/RpoP
MNMQEVQSLLEKPGVDQSGECTRHDTQYTHNITCPHCGYEDWDSADAGTNETAEIEIECQKCGKVFLAIEQFEVTYSTRKPEVKP